MKHRLQKIFFDRDAVELAKLLLGKVIFVKYSDTWLSAKIIETEAYYLAEKASHASLGFTEKRKALFLPAGTIYMYYARGGDSLNVSAQGAGNAVLIKSGVPYEEPATAAQMIAVMQRLNPRKNSTVLREKMLLCAGQTLLCRSLNLRVKEWNQKQFDAEKFYMADVGYQPDIILQTTRLGISVGRDEHLPYRFVDERYRQYCTKNPSKDSVSKIMCNDFVSGIE